MKKKGLIVLAVLLALVFSACLALAANNPSSRDTKSSTTAVTAPQNIQPAPAVAAPPQNYPPAPVGQYYPNGQYYPGWGCGYCPTNAGVPGGPYYNDSGNGYGCCW